MFRCVVQSVSEAGVTLTRESLTTPLGEGGVSIPVRVRDSVRREQLQAQFESGGGSLVCGERGSCRRSSRAVAVHWCVVSGGSCRRRRVWWRFTCVW